MLNKCLFPTTDVLIRFTSAAFVIVLTACQSEEQRIANLRSEETMASLLVQASEQRCDSLLHATKLPPAKHLSDPTIRACIDTLHTRRLRLDLAERDLNRFMHR